jgi:hypothetical protein
MQPYGKLDCFATWFLKNSLFDFVYTINVKDKTYFSMFDSMPMVNAIFHEGENMGSKHVL